MTNQRQEQHKNVNVYLTFDDRQQYPQLGNLD